MIEWREDARLEIELELELLENPLAPPPITAIINAVTTHFQKLFLNAAFPFAFTSFLFHIVLTSFSCQPCFVLCLHSTGASLTDERVNLNVTLTFNKIEKHATESKRLRL